MMPTSREFGGAAVRLIGLRKSFAAASRPALENIDACIPAGCIAGIVGSDGAGKTTLLRLLAGLLRPDAGEIRLFGKPMTSQERCGEDVGYMPQQFGLYEDLSVMDNLVLHARLREVPLEKRGPLFDRLLSFTGLTPFAARLAGRLSGGMKQKLGLACTLLGSPRLIVLDEPGVGVDPLSRRELWKMVESVRSDGVSVIWATAYLDEAERCDWLVLLEAGRLLYQGPPAGFMNRVRGRVFFQTLPESLEARQRALATWLQRPQCLDVRVQGNQLRLLLREPPQLSEGLIPRQPCLEDAYMDSLGGIDKEPSVYLNLGRNSPQAESRHGPLIEARGLTRRFGTFMAADSISFTVKPGTIFGLLGPNGAGKSTTFRMLCGLLPPSAGAGFVAGVDLGRAPGKARSRLGYMAQKFSLYGDMTVEQNLRLFSDLYGVSHGEYRERSRLLLEAMGLDTCLRTPARLLPLGQKQRLALVCATLHNPQVIFLDEPTSGVDPRTRREFWNHITALAAQGKAVLVTTHFMDEAEYCDEIALVYHGRIIAMGSPDSLKRAWAPQVGVGEEDPLPSLEEAFIACIEACERETPA